MKIDHGSFKKREDTGIMPLPGSVIRGLPTQELYLVAQDVKCTNGSQARLIRIRDGKDTGSINSASNLKLYRDETDDWIMQGVDS